MVDKNTSMCKIIKGTKNPIMHLMDNCSTFSMVTKNTSMCKIIKGTKTPIKYLMGKCHFNWLINC